ncbi:hypothetical protein CVT25_002681 [Psilocybe cyanescens]|uniref:Uncharacterized protein n=1 Tax=Psilocybe cyanescens TaxID=93625 RepID=A0A409WLS0_PSICY|nr:hypothetical protein CVT25_002681 [Psilocybe cyanescens]
MTSAHVRTFASQAQIKQMEWHESDPSDDEHHHLDDTQTTSRKRSSRGSSFPTSSKFRTC